MSLSASAAPRFLDALRRREYPASVCVERDFIVTYSTGTCGCDNCRRQRTVRALSHGDARNEAQRLLPLAWILSVDKA